MQIDGQMTPAVENSHTPPLLSLCSSLLVLYVTMPNLQLNVCFVMLNIYVVYVDRCACEVLGGWYI